MPTFGAASSAHQRKNPFSRSRNGRCDEDGAGSGSTDRAKLDTIASKVVTANRDGQ